MDPLDSPLRSFLLLLRRRALLLVLIPVLTGGFAFGAVSREEPVYRATMKIVAGQAGGQTLPVLGGQALTQTMTNLLQANVVAERALSRARIDSTVAELLKDLHVAVRPDSSVLDVSYESTDKEEAVRVLDAVADVFVSQVEAKLGVRSSISQTRGAAGGLFFASVFDPPHLEPKAISPKPAKSVGFAIALGIVLGILLVLALENLDDRIRSRQAAESSFGAAVLGSVPRRMRRTAVVTGRGGNRKERAVTQALQLLRAKVEFGDEAETGSTVVVTSAHHDQGKSALGANLAATLALAGRTVICVDADGSRPAVQRYLLGTNDEPGLSEVVAGSATLEEALQDIDLGTPVQSGNGAGDAAHPSLVRVLTAGGARTGGALTPDTAAALVAQLRKEAEYVIIVAPPLLVGGDALPLASAAEHVLVAARQGEVTTADADGVRRSLDGVGARQVGIVLTDA